MASPTSCPADNQLRKTEEDESNDDAVVVDLLMDSGVQWILLDIFHLYLDWKDLRNAKLVNKKWNAFVRKWMKSAAGRKILDRRLERNWRSGRPASRVWYERKWPWDVSRMRKSEILLTTPAWSLRDYQIVDLESMEAELVVDPPRHSSFSKFEGTLDFDSDHIVLARAHKSFHVGDSPTICVMRRSDKHVMQKIGNGLVSATGAHCNPIRGVRMEGEFVVTWSQTKIHVFRWNSNRDRIVFERALPSVPNGGHISYKSIVLLDGSWLLYYCLSSMQYDVLELFNLDTCTLEKTIRIGLSIEVMCLSYPVAAVSGFILDLETTQVQIYDFESVNWQTPTRVLAFVGHDPRLHMTMDSSRLVISQLKITVFHLKDLLSAADDVEGTEITTGGDYCWNINLNRRFLSFSMNGQGGIHVLDFL